MFIKSGKLFIAFLAVCLSLIGAFVAAAQEWRPILPDELQMKAAKVEADADAEAIFWGSSD